MAIIKKKIVAFMINNNIFYDIANEQNQVNHGLYSSSEHSL